jgi:dTDP-4-dehydrorhamnose reductase
MRVLILGNKGMLGHDMETVFHGQDFIGLDKEELDILNKEKVYESFLTVQPDVVINCAAYTNVDRAEDEENLANLVNGYSVGVLASACREIDALFVHISTDYVFDGEKRQGYNEEDHTSPINAYGRSKMLGENLLFDEMEMLDQLNPVEGRYFLIRTSWLFGHYGANFVDKMLALAQEEQEIKVVNDQFGKPTYTLDLCKQIKWLIDTKDYPSGTYHVTNEGSTSWYDFAKEIYKLSDISAKVVPCSTAEIERKAKRPMFSILNNNKLPPLRSWQEALKEYLTPTK